MKTFQTGPYDQIILFGDSITEQSASQERGFAFMPALQDIYLRRLDVINRGFSGYNTDNGLVVLPMFMPTVQEAHSIFFGANDACLPGSSSDQHVPLHKFVENIRTIIAHPSVEAHQPHIVLITPPPIDEYRLEEHDLLVKGITEIRRTAENTKRYADACREVGEELGVPVLDIWSAIMAKAGWKPDRVLVGSKKAPRSPVLLDLLIDGLHFTPNGYELLFIEFMRTIGDAWPDLTSDRIPLHSPSWQQALKGGI